MGWLVSVACAVISGLGLQQSPSSKHPNPRPQAKPTTPSPTARTDDSTGEAGDRPTAEDILKALQRQRPVNEVIPPAGAPNWPPDRRRSLLLPEGAAVVSQSGYLKADGSWWTFAPDLPDHKPPTRLLPNADLEVMVRTAAGSPTPVKFVVSGETTVFKDENYVLVRVVRRVLAADTPQPTLEETAEPSRPAQRPSPDREQPRAAQSVADEAVAHPSPEDVVALLQQQRPKEEVMAAPSDLPPERPVRIVGLAQTLVQEGAPLVSRPGRLLRRGDWWTFVFESDHPEHPEPPIKLLPNKSLELMVKATEREPLGLVFLVSGETTVFQGENYLLSRVAIQRLDTGNIRR